MRIFLDAKVLFSAARSSGAIRQLVLALHALGHSLVADEYVAEEARRNVAAKAGREAVDYLQALLGQMEVNAVQYQSVGRPQCYGYRPKTGQCSWLRWRCSATRWLPATAPISARVTAKCLTA
jgi:hypothetical protein